MSEEGEFKKRIKQNSIMYLINDKKEEFLMTNHISDILEDTKKALENCKDYDSLKKELVRWLGE